MTYDDWKCRAPEDDGYYRFDEVGEDEPASSVLSASEQRAYARELAEEAITGIRTGISSDNREAWLAARRQYVCGSEVAAMLGESPYADATRGSVVMEKAGLADPWVGSEQAAIGQYQEPGIAEFAAVEWGWKLVRFGELVVDAECPYLAATPDYLLLTPWGLANVQVKFTTSRAHEDCKPKRDGSPSEALYAQGAPLHFQLQQQAELACLGLEWSVLLVLHACPPAAKVRAYPVRRHEGAIGLIRREAVLLMRDVYALREGELVAE